MISLPVGMLVKMLNEHKASDDESNVEWGPNPYPQEPGEPKAEAKTEGKLNKMYKAKGGGDPEDDRPYLTGKRKQRVLDIRKKLSAGDDGKDIKL